MGGGRSVSRLAVAVLAVAWAVSGAPGAGVSRAAASCGSLSLGTGPPVGGSSGGGSELSDVGFVSARESWAVGSLIDSVLHAHQTLIERFGGSGWSVIPSPNQSTMNNGLNGVSMVPGGGWAVGYALERGSSGPKYQPLALRWDGAHWSLASPAGFPSDTLLTGVDATADGSAWAVGFQSTAGGTRRTLAEHASGGVWARVVTPNDGANTSDNTLTAVGGTPATGFWAVGYRQSPVGLKPLVLRYGTTGPSPSWVSVSGAGGVPSPGKVDTVLTGVYVRTASDVWTVGYYDDGAGQRPLALHWDGSSWAASAVPGIGMLRQVRAVEAGNVWSAGAYYNASEHRSKSLLVHFDGTRWATVVSADAAHTPDELIGLAANPAGSAITVVGAQGASPLIEQASCPTGPVSLPARTAPQAGPVPPAPGIGPAPGPPPPTPPPTAPVAVTMTDRAAAAGILGGPEQTWSAAVADFSADGWPDLFVSHHGHPPQLWPNNHDGTFRQADAGSFKAADRHDCVAGDFNADGLQDIFCSVGADRGTAVKSNELYVQQPGHTFTEQAYQWDLTDPLARGRYSAVLDANNDGYPDIFAGSAALRPDGMPAPDRFYRNTGHGSMLDSPGMGLDLDIGSGCAHAVDYNSDGWPDLLACGRYDTGPLGLHLYRNDQGRRFQDVSPVLGPPVAAEDAVMADVNHDSRADLITLTGAKVAERLQRADGTFAAPQTILTVKDGVSLAVGDVNGDHNPDIYVVGGRTGTANAPDYLLLGNTSGGFTSKPVPETTTGHGDGAYPLDYNGDGLTDFLVLNGRDHYPGPIQLLAPR